MRRRNWRKVLDVGDTENSAPSPPSNPLWGRLEAPCPGLGVGAASLGTFPSPSASSLRGKDFGSHSSLGRDHSASGVAVHSP